MARTSATSYETQMSVFGTLVSPIKTFVMPHDKNSRNNKKKLNKHTNQVQKLHLIYNVIY